ncbi:MAG: hypothetical protein E6I39_08525 [Chloroflexi bacterium]|nr:MAG: hypothetical protein E6I39_08525 [Chloroflexota bacterium]
MAELSYVHGASSVPLVGEPIFNNLRRTAGRFGDRDALVVPHQGYRATYSQLVEQSEEIGRGLMSRGVEKGDRVGIWSPNRHEWVLVQYATAAIGAILVNINPAYRTSELQYALNQSGISFLVLAAGFRTADYRAMLAEVKGSCPALKEALVLEDGFDALKRDAAKTSIDELREREATLQFDDPINIQYTSGTTGFPKGATLTHHNILNNAFFIGEALRYTEQDRVCIPVPFYHCFGMVLGNLACTTHGSAMVIPGEAYDPVAVMETVQKERCTSLYGVPTMFIGELCSRGYMVMLGYWNNEEATRQAIDAARWMHTGDLATMDEDGYLNIVGRIKDMIIRGGENIYPREVEEFLYGHPMIADVQVIGVPSEKYGEEVMAWVKLREGSTIPGEELAAWCKGKIASYKIPRHWKFVDGFPMTVTGKIQKFKMRETSIDELGLEKAAGVRTA